MSNFGIMEGAYFVGRIELLTWLDEFFGIKYEKVEQCCSGAAYCQIIDACYPNKLHLNKVNFSAKHEYEFIQNFKVLQQGFDAVNLRRTIPVQLLTKGKYQDNLEFLQWIKRLFESEYNPETNYNAAERRAAATQSYLASKRVRQKKTSCTSTASSIVSVSATPAGNSNASRSRMPPATARKARASVSVSASSAAHKDMTTSNTVTQTAQKDNQRMKEEVVKMRRIARALEKERDFYFSKLQQMDYLFHNSQYDPEDPFIKLLQTIVYAEEPPTVTEERPKPVELKVSELAVNNDEKENYDNFSCADVSNSPIF